MFKGLIRIYLYYSGLFSVGWHDHSGRRASPADQGGFRLQFIEFFAAQSLKIEFVWS